MLQNRRGSVSREYTAWHPRSVVALRLIYLATGGAPFMGRGPPRHADLKSAMSVDAPLYTPDYADLTLLVGTDPSIKEFKIHRHIVTVNSKFFKVICNNPNFKEGREQIVKLPEVDVDTAHRLLRWFYQEPLDLPDDIISDEGYPVMINLVNAADFLEIERVIVILRDATAGYLKHCSKWSEDRELAKEEEQRKVDLMCRIYECGVKIDGAVINRYLRRLKRRHKLGMFMDMVSAIEDCHHALFEDIMVALYATVDMK
ncbi:hypothetical protein TWF694_005762 [Orbilia ellipsospora]|uniref:BTB domain-containing protein n=1 Tax=Orbilia ellipsospora TaxID=2528407 RepID=A0AAV9WU03_9PEZI